MSMFLLMEGRCVPSLHRATPAELPLPMPHRCLALLRRNRKKMKRKKRKRSKSMKEVMMRRRSTTTMMDLHRLSQPSPRGYLIHTRMFRAHHCSRKTVLVVARRSRMKPARRETRSIPLRGGGRPSNDVMLSY
jgi:hypothetical protein